MRVLSSNTSDFVCTELIQELWKYYRKQRKFNRLSEDDDDDEDNFEEESVEPIEPVRSRATPQVKKNELPTHSDNEDESNNDNYNEDNDYDEQQEQVRSKKSVKKVVHLAPIYDIPLKANPNEQRLRANNLKKVCVLT